MRSTIRLINFLILLGTTDYLCFTDMNGINIARTLYLTEPLDLGCRNEFVKLATRIMVRERLYMPKSAENALMLFQTLM